MCFVGSDCFVGCFHVQHVARVREKAIHSLRRCLLTQKKKGLPEEIPAPPTASSKSGGESSISEEQLEALINGDVTFQDFFNLSDDVLLAWANQGYFFYNQGKYTEAATIFEGLVALNPNVAYYHTALGSILEAQEKYDEALEEFNTALKTDAKDICAMVNRGEIRLRKGQVLEAAEDFRTAITHDEEKMTAQKAKGEKPTPDPAAQRARALSMVTFEVLKEIEAKVREAQARGEIIE